LIPESAEAIEPYVTNNQPSIERVLSNEEFNLLDEDDRQMIRVKTEGNPVTLPTRPTGPTNFPTPPCTGCESLS